MRFLIALVIASALGATVPASAGAHHGVGYSRVSNDDGPCIKVDEVSICWHGGDDKGD